MKNGIRKCNNNFNIDMRRCVVADMLMVNGLC